MATIGAALEAPKQETLDAPSDGIQIESLQRDASPEFLKQLGELHFDGFGAKRCCLCFGHGKAEMVTDLKSALAKAPDSKLDAYGVALFEGNVVGFAQLGFPDTVGDIMDPSILQVKASAGYCHLERIVVSSTMRGKGLGTKLLDWVDAKARDKGSKTVNLEVVNGNPAKKLYERQGYVSNTNTCQKISMCPCIFCILGHLYVDFMYKSLWVTPVQRGRGRFRLVRADSPTDALGTWKHGLKTRERSTRQEVCRVWSSPQWTQRTKAFRRWNTCYPKTLLLQ